jgi:hypothetical protein
VRRGAASVETLQPERALVASGRSRSRGGRGCPDTGHAAHPPVRVLCPPCGRPGPGVKSPRVRVSSVRCPASGVRVSGCPGVRVQGPRPLHPRCPHRGGSWSAPVRRSNPPWAHRVWRSRRGVCERLGRLPGSGLAWRSRGWPCMARTSVDPAAASEAHRLRRHARRLAGQGICPAPGCRPVGWEAPIGTGAHRVLLHGRPRQVPAWTVDHRAEPEHGDYAEWSLCWGGPDSPSTQQAIRVRWGEDRGRSAAAGREERCLLGGDRALTCTSSWWARQGLNL